MIVIDTWDARHGMNSDVALIPCYPAQRRLGCLLKPRGLHGRLTCMMASIYNLLEITMLWQEKQHRKKLPESISSNK